MPINGLPILHILIAQLGESGFSNITLAVGYMAEMIRTYLGDGGKLGIHISYSEEKEPLGTIGVLSLINELPENFLVMNGDILTDLDFSDFFDFHLKKKGIATVATYPKEMTVEYGIIECGRGNHISGYREKPELQYQVSMEIYAFNSAVLRFIKGEIYLDFPDLMKLLIKKGKDPIRFLFSGYWKDIRCHTEYEKAAEDFEMMKGNLLKEPIVR